MARPDAHCEFFAHQGETDRRNMRLYSRVAYNLMNTRTRNNIYIIRAKDVLVKCYNTFILIVHF